MKKKLVIIFLLVITVIALMLLCRCSTKEEYAIIPVPDESHIVIDEVTLEQIEERARELESKYSDNMGMEYEDFYSLLVGSNYDYLSNESRRKWQTLQENYNNTKSACLDYIGFAYFNWDFLYSINQGYKPFDYSRCPHLSELFFDDDLIEQADFIEKQLYNFVFEQDDSAMYNFISYIHSEEHSMTTEYAPLHYQGEIMQGSAGFCINRLAVRMYNETIIGNEKFEGYRFGDESRIMYPSSSGVF